MKPVIILIWVLAALGVACVVQTIGPYVTGGLVAAAIYLRQRHAGSSG